MYPEYFGLKEPSFSITPDPQYLYLSQEHREALAHLIYGAVESGGFVLLTGEVGTGKTTICRAFLEQLPEQVDVALVLNPALTAPELLHAVCDEFGIEVPTDGVSAKVLVDLLNSYLLQAHANGRRPVLMIDEAQNLKPEVLEQIRLLTNLETHKHKLLQIFLVGQPELRTLLQQQGLRQLAQRITARYHLLPLNARETGDYIVHRLAVAGVQRRLFTAAAVRRIYRLSKGVPRLINILCDRALLGAFATHRQVVDARIVAKAARELSGERRQSRRRDQSVPLRWLLVSAFLLTTAGGLAYVWSDLRSTAPNARLALADKAYSKPTYAEQQPPTAPPAMEPASTEITLPETGNATISAIAPALAAPSEPEAPVPPPLAQLASGERSAMKRLLASWGIDYPQTENMAACDFAETQGLHCRQSSGGWRKLRFYDRPAVIRLNDGNGQQDYLSVIGLGQDHALVDTQNGTLRVPIDRLDGLWAGNFLILWRPPPGGYMLINSSSSGDIVRWLRQLMGQIPGSPGGDRESTVFDSELRDQVRRFQTGRGLAADGIVGPETLIQMSSAARVADTPRLQTAP